MAEEQKTPQTPSFEDVQAELGDDKMSFFSDMVRPNGQPSPDEE